MRIVYAAVLATMVSAKLPPPTQYGVLPFRGVNLAGADFGPYPGLIPVAGDGLQFGIAGMNTFRLPFRWEAAQPKPGGALDPSYMQPLVAVAEDLLGAGYSVLLDLHNYMRYNGTVVTPDQLRDVWEKLLAPGENVSFFSAAKRFGGNGSDAGPQLMLDLMNEPHGISAAVLLANLNGAIAGARASGLANALLLEGNGWSGLHSWMAGSPPNAETMVPSSFSDPKDRLVINVHQYLDQDSSGTHPDCVPASTVPARTNFSAFAAWARQHRWRVFLSEFGAADNANCRGALASLLSLVNASADTGAGGFVGFTAWAAGHAWGSKYFMGLNPGDQASLEMLSVYAPRLSPPDCDGGYLLGFNSTPPGVASGFSVQLHTPDWKTKSTVAHASGGLAPGLVCVPATCGACSGAALYDDKGKQYTCRGSVGPAAPVLQLDDCRA